LTPGAGKLQRPAVDQMAVSSGLGTTNKLNDPNAVVMA
jgi:hypothetical protein